MGRQSEAIITHFSHPHSLHLTNPQPSRTCSACNQTIETEPLYTCRYSSPSCTTFSLHLKCTQLPHKITHPCHQHNHHLNLHPNSVFTCNACGKHRDHNGFSYGCKDCGINIHVACAKLPLSVSHRSHPHQLNLVFSPPYGSNIAFSCDVCGVVDGESKCWLYRCGPCGFDAHLSCVKTLKDARDQVFGGGGRSSSDNFERLYLEQVNNKRDQMLQALMGMQGGNMNNQMMNGGNMNTYNQLLQAMIGGGGGGGDINNQLFQTMIGGAGGGNMNTYNQLLQAMMGGAGVGGGDMNNQLFQTMMGGAGGGNMNTYNQLLQAMMGGAGVGVGDMNNQLLQEMMNGGGGGGVNNQILQAMMGGGGGGGGVDLSSIFGKMGDFGGLMGAGFGGFGF